MGAITAASNHLRIPPAFIEKDYWITMCLKNLSANESLNKWVVFKGGTALSKVYSIIRRFSEDIDLALLQGAISKNGINPNSSQALYRTIKGIVPEEFTQIEEPKDSFKERYKRVYEYPKVNAATARSLVHGNIVIETNAMGNPEPHKENLIESYITVTTKQIFTPTEHEQFIQTFDLAPFLIKVVPVEKTFCEKILAIRKAYNRFEVDGNAKFFHDRLRHIYDLFHILQRDEYVDFLSSAAFLKYINTSLSDDERSRNISGQINESLVFKDPSVVLGSPSTASAWEGLKIMTFDNTVPDFESVSEKMKLIQSALLRNGL